MIDGIQEGWLSSRVFAVLPLARVADAHRLLEDHQAIGKILLSTEH